MKILLIVAVLVASLSRGSADLSKRQKQVILDEHNKLRCKVARGDVSGQPPASNMVLLRWDDRPARVAQGWSRRCSRSHNYNRGTFSRYTNMGENAAYWGRGYYSGLHGPVKSWFDEHKHYNYASKRCYGTCGHYTQVVWAKSTVVGCGLTDTCPGSYNDYLFCDYAPAGNWNNEYPYKKGRACSACPSGYSKCIDGCCARPEDCRGHSKCTDSRVDESAHVELYRPQNSENIKTRVPGEKHKIKNNPAAPSINNQRRPSAPSNNNNVAPPSVNNNVFRIPNFSWGNMPSFPGVPSSWMQAFGNPGPQARTHVYRFTYPGK